MWGPGGNGNGYKKGIYFVGCELDFKGEKWMGSCLAFSGTRSSV